MKKSIIFALLFHLVKIMLGWEFYLLLILLKISIEAYYGSTTDILGVKVPDSIVTALNHLAKEFL